MPHNKLFKDVLLILAVLCLIFIAYFTYILNNKVKNYTKKEVENIVVGMDNNLSTVVDSLEKALVERSKLQFHASIDPLDLTKVIIKIPPEILALQEKELKAKEDKQLIKRSELRLNATILSNDGNSAVFFFNGKNLRVKEGEKIDNKKIISITEGSVVVEESGLKKVYTTKK